MDEIDENGDNRISKNEFSDLIEKVFMIISTDDMWYKIIKFNMKFHMKCDILCDF